MGRARWAAVVVVAGVLAASACRAPAPDPEIGTGPVLFRDDFSGGSLGSSWGTCHWWAPDGCTILTNDELEWYQPGQVEVRDGVLRLTAAPGDVRAHGRRFPYVSGMVSTGRPGDEPEDRPRFAFTYGRVEVRFRVPEGAGTWPAVWMLPVTNEALPEIDLIEVTGDATDRPAVTLHPAAGGRHREDVRTDDLSAGWHVVRLDWSPGLLAWSIDGDEAMRVTGDDVPDEPMYLVANLAVGGDAGAPPASTAFPTSFLVDHVTVWGRP